MKNTRKRFCVKDFGAVGDGKQIDTEAFQQTIQAAAKVQGCVVVESGIYLLGSIFLQSHMEFYLAEGAVLLGIQDIAAYPVIASRVAGIEMEWPAALVNVLHGQDVRIFGPGIMDGQGEYWWNLYWGKDGNGGLRKTYDQQNLRWIADYEIQRPRLFLAFDCKNLVLEGFQAKRAGFWTVQLTYCQRVLVRGLQILENHGPSTDGIDIDSCSEVGIEKCRISCNDDDIVIKSGRDADGQRVNRPSEKIEIWDCEILSGAGITLGSEVSGGIRDVYIHDIVFKQTDCGFRIKSSWLRGGFIEDIRVHNLQMEDVRFPFSWILDWHPAYNEIHLPKGKKLPGYWQKIAGRVPIRRRGTYVRRILVSDVKAGLSKNQKQVSRAFDLQGCKAKPMEGIVFQRVKLVADEFGRIENIKNLRMETVQLSIRGAGYAENDVYDRR